MVMVQKVDFEEVARIEKEKAKKVKSDKRYNIKVGREIRNWNKFLHYQKFGSECKVTTAMNVYYYLTGKQIKIDSKRYDSLVDLAGARHGTAICVEKVWKRLGLEIVNTFTQNDVFRDFIICRRKIKLPMEATIQHKYYHFHSVLIVDQDVNKEMFRIANFRYACSKLGWIFYEDFERLLHPMYKYHKDNSSAMLDKKEWVFRLYKLREK